MMFLQYAVWGAWIPVAARFLTGEVAEGGLGFSGAQVGTILGVAGSVGAIVAPFAGQLADRYFRTERCLATLLVIGGCLNWYLAAQTSYESWLWLSVAYSVVFMPTLGLSNSLAFSHLEDRDKHFPWVRLWGTVGWIAASVGFARVWLGSGEDNLPLLIDSLRFSAILSFAYAGYCLLLPETPPKRDSASIAFTKAFALFQNRSFVVLVIASLAISIIHNIYFMQAGPFLKSVGVADEDLGPAMSIGQISEIVVMFLLGWTLAELDLRRS